MKALNSIKNNQSNFELSVLEIHEMVKLNNIMPLILITLVITHVFKHTPLITCVVGQV